MLPPSQVLDDRQTGGITKASKHARRRGQGRALVEDCVCEGANNLLFHRHLAILADASKGFCVVPAMSTGVKNSRVTSGCASTA